MNVFTFVFLTVTVVLCAKLVQAWIENRDKNRSANEEVEATAAAIEAMMERYDLKKRIDNL